MVSDAVYDQCLPILQDSSLEEEDKTDQLEARLRGEIGLVGSALENAVLDVLWRFRESTTLSPSPPPARHVVLRRASPAPWSVPRGSTPLASSPGSGISLALPAAFARAKSSTASPFTSPRPSPRLAFSSPRIPHSPNLNAYEFPTETSPGPDLSGDFDAENVDWLVNDDAASMASSAGAALAYEGASATGLGAGFSHPQPVEMSPYDILRSVLGQAKSDEEIERALEANGYDLTTAIKELMGDAAAGEQTSLSSAVTAEKEATIVVGKSMTPNPPSTPGLGGGNPQQRSGVVCKYFLSSGACLRADCRFSHDLSNHVCKYWLMGSCLAGESCVFSHDPSLLMNRLAVDENGMMSSSPPNSVGGGGGVPPGFSFQDYHSFPALQQMMSNQWAGYQSSLDALSYASMYGGNTVSTPPPGFMAQPGFLGEGSVPKRPRSRPSSRHSRAATPSLPSVDDTDAFPSLGSSSASNAKAGKKHYGGKRGAHGHGHRENSKENVGSTLADIVRMSPSPSPSMPARQQPRKTTAAPAAAAKPRRNPSNSSNGREQSATAQAIPAPQHLPWLVTGEKANKAYLKARQEAIKHGGLRNKFLQSAAQAWNRNDARAAKTYSLRGQNENELMRKCHREAARQLLLHPVPSSTGEIHIDLHGLHPSEATQQLERLLSEQQQQQQQQQHSTSDPPPGQTMMYVYVIIPVLSGKDKVGKVIRGWLNDVGYAYREFSPGVTPTVGGSGGQGVGAGVNVLGIDPRSLRVEDEEEAGKKEGSSQAAPPPPSPPTTTKEMDGRTTTEDTVKREEEQEQEETSQPVGVPDVLPAANEKKVDQRDDAAAAPSALPPPLAEPPTTTTPTTTTTTTTTSATTTTTTANKMRILKRV